MAMTYLETFPSPGIAEITAVLEQHGRADEADEARRYGAGIGYIEDRGTQSPLTGSTQEVDAWVIHLRARSLWVAQFGFGSLDGDTYFVQTLTPIEITTAQEAYDACLDRETVARHLAAGASIREEAL